MLSNAVYTRDFASGAPGNAGVSRVSVSERMQMFERRADESRRQRVSPTELRNSPFKGALDAFSGGGVTTPAIDDHLAYSSSENSCESSDRNCAPLVEPAHGLKTRIGNRDVQPLVDAPRPPPLVGLPIPKAQHVASSTDSQADAAKASEVRGRRSIRQTREETTHRMSVRQPRSVRFDLVAQHEEGRRESDVGTSQAHAAEEHADPPSSPENNAMSSRPQSKDREPLSQSLSHSDAPDCVDDTSMGFEDPDLIPRFSYRHSMRVARGSVGASIANDAHTSAPRASFRHSTRFEKNEVNDLNLLPESSSFLDFDDDERLSPLDELETGEGNGTASVKPPSVWAGMSFDDPDSFDTFATLPNGPQSGKQLQADFPTDANADVLRPGSDESEKPLFPMMSFSKKCGKSKSSLKRVEEDDDGTLDVPKRFTYRPGAEGALRELQRVSITAGNEISESLQMMNVQQENSRHTKEAPTKHEQVSKVQGDILMRNRIFRRWNLRYASIIHQGYFGAVLLLFRADVRGGLGGAFSLRSSKMIALADCDVKKVENVRRPSSMYMFELKTSQRRYMFACNDEEGRDFWIKNLGSSIA